MSPYGVLRYFRRFGVIITAIATLKHIISLAQGWYYTRKVERTAKTVGSDLSVNGPSRVSTETELGNNVNFNGMYIRGGGPVKIGDNFHSGPECRVLTRNHNYDEGDAIPYDDTYLVKKVVIKDNVWIGAGVTIIPGVTIGEGAIIQAGSTVTRDVPDGAIAGGHPIEVFDQRDMSHYESLKDEGKFH